MRKIKKVLSILRYLPHTLYFNFRYFPFKQALKIPVILYKPRFIACKGKVVIEKSLDDIKGNVHKLQLAFEGGAFPEELGKELHILDKSGFASVSLKWSCFLALS